MLRIAFVLCIVLIPGSLRAVQDRLLDDFAALPGVPGSYTLGSIDPPGTQPSMSLVVDPAHGQVLEVRANFPCTNLAEPAIGALPDEPDCAEDYVVLRRALSGSERANFRGFGGWVRADPGIEFRLRLARVIVTPSGPRLQYRTYPAYRPVSVRAPGDWFWLGIDVDAQPLDVFDEPWSGASPVGWHAVEWFAYPSAAAQQFAWRLSAPTLLAARLLQIEGAAMDELRDQSPSLAGRITLDIGFLNRNTDFNRVDADLARIRALRVDALRISQEWGATQQAVGGPLHWGPLDTFRTRLVGQQWRLLVILGLANPWYAQHCTGRFAGLPPTEACPVYRAAWREFVAQKTARLATHAGPLQYELWNEPNLYPFWQPGPRPLEYASLARETLGIARTQDPRAQVLVGSLTHRQGSPKLRIDIGYLRRMQAPDLYTQSDGFAWHPYRRLRTPPEQLADDALLLREALRGQGLAAPRIHDTEWGYSSVHFDPAGNGHSANARHAQAVYAARRWLVSAALGLEQIKWFNIRDGAHIEAPPDAGSAFDAERNFGLLTWPGDPKPAYQALATMLGSLREHRLRGVLRTHRHDLVVQHWEAGGRSTWVAWYAAALRDDGTWPMGAPAIRIPASARAWDLLGTPLEADAEGRLQLEAASGPVYVRQGGEDELHWGGFER